MRAWRRRGPRARRRRCRRARTCGAFRRVRQGVDTTDGVRLKALTRAEMGRFGPSDGERAWTNLRRAPHEQRPTASRTRAGPRRPARPAATAPAARRSRSGTRSRPAHGRPGYGPAGLRPAGLRAARPGSTTASRHRAHPAPTAPGGYGHRPRPHRWRSSRWCSASSASCAARSSCSASAPSSPASSPASRSGSPQGRLKGGGMAMAGPDPRRTSASWSASSTGS